MDFGNEAAFFYSQRQPGPVELVSYVQKGKLINFNSIEGYFFIPMSTPELVLLFYKLLMIR